MNSKGLFALQHLYQVDFSSDHFATEDGKCSVGFTHSITVIVNYSIPAKLEHCYFTKLNRRRKHKEMENPGKYTVILEPAASNYSNWQYDWRLTLAQRGADEGRSFYKLHLKKARRWKKPQKTKFRHENVCMKGYTSILISAPKLPLHAFWWWTVITQTIDWKKDGVSPIWPNYPLLAKKDRHALYVPQGG